MQRVCILSNGLRTCKNGWICDGGQIARDDPVVAGLRWL